MKTTNYFRSPNGTFFFDESHVTSVLTAWQNATHGGEIPCVYKAFALHGNWTGCDIIGFTGCEATRRRLVRARENGEDASLYQERLDEFEPKLRAAWADAGAFFGPSTSWKPQAVQA